MGAKGHGNPVPRLAKPPGAPSFAVAAMVRFPLDCDLLIQGRRPRTTSSPPAASILVALRAAQKRPKEARQKSAGAGQLTKIEDLPPRKPSARVLRSANKQKDNPDMTARTARRISQPDCAPRAPSRTRNGARTPPLPLAQLHPRNALPRVSLAARIRKVGRCLTAPLARRHSAQVLGVSASASCRARAHAQKLIDGTAIKSRANRRCFSDLQISNRR